MYLTRTIANCYYTKIVYSQKQHPSKEAFLRPTVYVYLQFLTNKEAFLRSIIEHLHMYHYSITT